MLRFEFQLFPALLKIYFVIVRDTICQRWFDIEYLNTYFEIICKWWALFRIFSVLKVFVLHEIGIYVFQTCIPATALLDEKFLNQTVKRRVRRIFSSSTRHLGSGAKSKYIWMASIQTHISRSFHLITLEVGAEKRLGKKLKKLNMMYESVIKIVLQYKEKSIWLTFWS